MKTGLTKREKLLIFVAAAALMSFVAFRFVIEPLQEHYTTKSNEYEMLATEKTKMELMLQSERVIRDTHSNYEGVFEGIEQAYPEVMPNEEIDRILTGLCMQNGLGPVSLKIPDAVDFKSIPHNDGQSEQSDDAERPAAFSTVKATMMLSGNYSALKRLISSIEKIDYIRIEQISFKYPENDERADVSNISASFEFIMRNPIEDSEAKAES